MCNCWAAMQFIKGVNPKDEDELFTNNRKSYLIKTSKGFLDNLHSTKKQENLLIIGVDLYGSL